MSIVIGTAGHIDHGKTSLVKALTGVDCDRLEEEKKRGITIELGFAALHIDKETIIGVVDVPGHEKFVKNMVAGASGIDAVMLVIAADESVMPQTKEHLEICNLLGIKHGLVALTKVDMVDDDMLELAKEEVEEFLQGSCLESAPIFPVSATKGIGLDDLKNHIIKLNKELTKENKSDLFRLSIDRAFSMKGHGTVITGTSIAGKALLNDELSVYPKNEIDVRIRAIQSHGESKEEIISGKRISINLANCSLEDIERGDVLAKPNSLFPCDRWLVKLDCLKSSPQAISHRKEVHFHYGAREITAKVYLFDRTTLERGESTLAEIRFTPPKNNENIVKNALVGVFNDKCVLRSSSPLRTIAGASVLMPLPYSWQHKEFTSEFIEKILLLEKYYEEDQQKFIYAHIELSSKKGRNFNELKVLTALNTKTIEKHISTLSNKGDILCYNKETKAYITKENYSQLEEKFINLIADYHKKEPLKQGMLRNMLISAKEISLDNSQEEQKLAFFVIERLVKSNKISYSNDMYHLPNFKVSLAQDEEKMQKEILKALQKNIQAPPNIKEILDELEISLKEVQPLLKILIENKKITKLTENMYYDTATLQMYEEKTRAYFEKNEDLDPAAFKEITNGLSRKYIIAILEYFDMQKFTLRVGDIRKLRK